MCFNSRQPQRVRSLTLAVSQVGEEDVRDWEFQRMINYIKAQSKVKLSLKSGSAAAF